MATLVVAGTLWPAAGRATEATAGATAGATAETLTLDLPTAHVFARAALAEGHGDLARSVALGLLKADPDSFAAHAILSAAEAQLGNGAAAAKAGRAAFRVARTDTERYEAATLTAQALSRSGAYTSAQIWLRRAAHAAPTEAARAGSERQYRGLRRINPLTVQLSFGIAPTSNVNNGARGETIDLFGLPFRIDAASQALSGVEVSAGIGLRYRLAESASRTTEAGLDLHSRFFRLSDSARAQAPEARGGDFAFQAAEATLSHRFRPDSAAAVYTLGGAVGRNWFGGAILTDYTRLTLGRSQALSPTTSLALVATGEWRSRRDEAARSSDSYELTGRIGRRLASGDGLALHAGLRRTRSASASIDHRAVRTGLRYARAEPVAGVSLAATIDLEWREYGGTALAPGGRTDRLASAGISATFRQIDYYGFSPTLDLRMRGVFSDVPVHDTREIGLRLGFASNF